MYDAKDSVLTCSENHVAKSWPYMFQISENSLSPDLHAVLSMRTTAPNDIQGDILCDFAVLQPL